jgi:hypothetical protein
MKTADSSDRPDREPPAWIMWLAHHQVTMIVLWAATCLTGNVWWMLTENPVVSIVGIVLAVFVIFFPPYAVHRHRRVLVCDWCHARTPLDPQAAVAQHKDKLIMQHRRYERPWCYLFWVVLLVMAVAPAGIWNLLGSLPFLAYIVSAVVMEKWHTRLQPWCPLCHDDDGPDDCTCVPDPEPDPVIEKTPDDQKVTLR